MGLTIIHTIAIMQTAKLALYKFALYPYLGLERYR
jgi:hypothetical protein